ncbi:putative nuclease HARBI1 [Mytilus edulis]|uniref:putative nuclease HARBI1 n=1 Tax=Mytilus edulis TaxID=6550 RepID=UPI0039EEC76A
MSVKLGTGKLDTGFPKVLGCIDGTYIKLKRPQEHEEEFVNRKGYHSLNVQAICDSKYRFISMKGNMPGSVHDSRIWKLSALRQQFDAGMHDGFLIGDSGYPCQRYLMTPFLNPSTPGQQKFNKSLCRTRVTIEQTFGIWKQRFTCLQRGIRACPADVVEITGTCAVLHNIGIDRHDIVDFDYIFENHQHIHELNLQNTMPPQRDGTATRQLIVENFFS